MRLTHFGHSCLLVETADRRVLIDPGTFAQGFESAHDLDAIVITHQHADHLDQDRIIELRGHNPHALVVADPQSGGILATLGVPTITAQDGLDIVLGELTLTGVGATHAFNHDRVPSVTNVGVAIRAAGEPTLYHPGDAYDGQPGPVDVLAVPLNAPWAAVRDTIDFTRRVAPQTLVPIHDALLSASGRAMYLGHVGTHGGDLRVLDLAGSGTAESVS